ncbi:MAG: DUF488 domain-containing protein [Bacteroides sp.]|nr:DUF488 domain-containing protein [Bacteroides sp.]MCM1391102.1 DUF488 domain-containing protein [Bacteroides sp.]
MEKLNRGVTAKSMQKLLFIFVKMQQVSPIYEFVPYKYGCFSFHANQDIVSLEKNGYISISHKGVSDKEYNLLHDMNAFGSLGLFDRQLVEDICLHYGKLSQNDLIAYTYKTWPMTAINSVIKDSLLTRDELQKVETLKGKFHNSEPCLFTIGYEGFSIESYLKQLIKHDIKVLVDVRKNAISRKYGFSKNILQKGCEGIGIRYIHLPQLGIDSDKRRNLAVQKDYDLLFDEYEDSVLNAASESLAYLKKLISHDLRICLTCFEKNPAQCHRTRVARALMRISDGTYKFSEILL